MKKIWNRAEYGTFKQKDSLIKGGTDQQPDGIFHINHLDNKYSLTEPVAELIPA